MSYEYVPQKRKIVYPPRIQQIAEEFEKHGFEYKGPTVDDKDIESWKEMGFEAKAKRSPDTVILELLAVYRLIDEYKNKEYMIWKIRKVVKDKDDNDYVAEIWYGKRPRFHPTAVTDDDGNEVGKNLGKWNMEYTQEWSKEVFDSIMRENKSKRAHLYVAETSDDYFITHTGTPIRIKDAKLYRDAEYDELKRHDMKLERQRLLIEAQTKQDKK